jgi:hypothetical protein
MQALRLQGSNNMRQMILGFTNYAVDNKDTLPKSNQHPWGFGPWYFAVNHSGDLVDLISVVKAYGMQSATAHPVTGTPMITDPVNNAAANSGFLATSWMYFPGYLSPNWAATTLPTQGPRRASAGPRYEMMQDMLIHVAGNAPPFKWQAIQVRSAAVRWIEGGVNNPSHVFFGTADKNALASPDTAEAIGAYCGYYDGSVSLTRTKDFKWALWNSAAGGLYFGHRQFDPLNP